MVKHWDDMNPIERIQHMRETDCDDLAEQKIKCLIDINIGHIDKPCLEVKYEEENWTTAPFHFILWKSNGVIDIY